MSSHQTIVVELGSSRIKVGFAGESKPRRVLNNDDNKFNIGISGWTVNINDGMVSNACQWSSLFQYLSPLTDSKSNKITTVNEWEKTLYPLFSHIITSILYIQRPSRHRILLLINDIFPPMNFREAIHKVLLDYLNIGAVWLVKGGVYEGLYHLSEGLPPSLPLLGKPKAHLIVDIGAYEARVFISVAGSSILTDTLQTAAVGYTSFLHQVLANYQEIDQEVEVNESGQTKKQKNAVSTLEDANAIVRAWMALCSSSSETLDTTNISVHLPSLETQQQQTPTQIPIKPLLDAFYQIYLDFSSPSSLIYAMLSCAMICPIDYRKCALQNTLLLGGGAVALQHFGTAQGDSAKGLSMLLKMAARDACGVSRDESISESIEEEKKEDGYFSDISSIARQRFRSLKGVVNGSIIGDDGKRMDGINIQYPDPFAADLATWIGGSIMGTLSYSQHYKKKV